jgi:hypothetical protein
LSLAAIDDEVIICKGLIYWCSDKGKWRTRCHHLGITDDWKLWIIGFLDFVHSLVLKITLENTAFRKLDLFPFSG